MSFHNEAVVVGAGVGGLVTACYLAKAGWKVKLLEANGVAGGKMAQVDLGVDSVTGFARRWDTGPTLVTLPSVLNAVFEDILPVSLEKPQLLTLSEGTSLHFEDGTQFSLPAAGKNFCAELPKVLGARDCAELTKTLEIAANVFDFAKETLLVSEPPSLLSLGLRTLTSGIALKYPFLAKQNYEEFVQTRFSNAHLRELFFHFASYVGLLPKCAASGLISVAHVEMNEEVVFPKGGVFEISKALLDAAILLGVEWIPSTAVKNSELQSNGQWVVSLVENAEGAPESTLQTRHLVVATDPHQALVNWLKCAPLMRSWYRDIDKNILRPSESQFVILFERSDTTRMAHHTKIFPKSWLESYRQTVEESRLSDDPCVYLVWPHATDPSVCPSVLFISAMAPHLGSGHNWNEEMCLQYSKSILLKVRQRLAVSLPGRIVKTVSPLDLFRKTGSLMGGLYGASPIRYNPGFFARPGVTKVPGLSFVGGGVHPGAGIPMVMMGARRVAQNLIKKEQLKS